MHTLIILRVLWLISLYNVGSTELPTTLKPTHAPGMTPSTTTVGENQSTGESSATTTKAELQTSMATTHSNSITVSTETTTATTSKSTQTPLSTTEFTELPAPETTKTEAGNDARATTDLENVTTTTWLLISADKEQGENGLIASILIPTIVVLLVSGIVVVILCLILGRCASKRLHKHRRYDLTSFSVKAPNGKSICIPREF